MHIFKEIEALRAFLLPYRSRGQSIGFVPTMGALHEGHLALIRQSKAENNLTVCSIYVNPAQFNNPMDLAKYPRQLEADSALLKAEKCDVIFAPENAEMYPSPSTLTFDFGPLDKVLEGSFRPGHFSGVALVVGKLLNIVRPTRAYFGQKDYQQFLIVSQLVNQLAFDVTLQAFPTVREASGLALSSRNQRLSTQGRQNATLLIETLQRARHQLKAGNNWPDVLREAEQHFRDSGFARLEYLALADRINLLPIEDVTTESLSRAILLIAAYVEEVRLIDNLFVGEDQR